jgi:hypothetical protein
MRVRVLFDAPEPHSCVGSEELRMIEYRIIAAFWDQLLECSSRVDVEITLTSRMMLMSRTNAPLI